MSLPVFDFRLKGFGIRQRRTAMKVSTDAILLGSWAATLGLRPERLLDVGTGTGIILLMLMQELEPKFAVGIDIAKSLGEDTEYNCRYSPWHERIELIHGDVLGYCPDQKFDLIVSNPPYFEVGGFSCPDEGREYARREQGEGLTLRRLMHKAAGLLSPSGELLLITPQERETDLRLYATETKLRLSRAVRVYSKEGSPIRLLSSWQPIHIGQDYTPTEYGSLTLRNPDGSYTEEYRLLTKPFLL